MIYRNSISEAIHVMSEELLDMLKEDLSNPGIHDLKICKSAGERLAWIKGYYSMLSGTVRTIEQDVTLNFNLSSHYDRLQSNLKTVGEELSVLQGNERVLPNETILVAAERLKKHSHVRKYVSELAQIQEDICHFNQKIPATSDIQQQTKGVLSLVIDAQSKARVVAEHLIDQGYGEGKPAKIEPFKELVHDKLVGIRQKSVAQYDDVNQLSRITDDLNIWMNRAQYMKMGLPTGSYTHAWMASSQESIRKAFRKAESSLSSLRIFGYGEYTANTAKDIVGKITNRTIEAAKNNPPSQAKSSHTGARL